MNRRRSRISPEKQGLLIRFFVAGGSARAVAEHLGMNRHTVRLYFQKLRETIAAEMDARFNTLPKDLRGRFRRFECDANYVKSTVGVSGVVPMFGIIGSVHDVFTVAVPCEIREAISSQSQSRRTLRTPAFADDMIVVRSLKGPSVQETLCQSEKPELKQFFLFSAVAELLIKHARVRLQYCRGLSSRHFHLFLKECEFFVSEKSERDRLLAHWMELEDLPTGRLNKHALDMVQGKVLRAELRKRRPKGLRERTTVPTTV